MAAKVTTRGMEAVRELYQNRRVRAEELKRQGKKIVGYFCCYPPLEFLTAAGLVPYRIMGNIKEPIAQADAYLETIACPYIRSCLDEAFRGDFAFLDGLIAPHSCDNVQRIYDIWSYYQSPSWAYCLNVPHMLQASSFEFFKSELATLRKSIGAMAGTEITDEKLRQAIRLHNESRALVRELYQLRKPDPPLVRGSEITEVLVAGSLIPVAEFNDLLRGIVAELKGRSERPQKLARVMVYGCEIDDTAFMKLIEDCGAHVVMDDLCIGSRFYWHDVEVTPDPLDGLARRYLEKLVCPRTYRPSPGSHEADLENRFGYLRGYAQEFNVKGVILYIIRFCDTHEFDVPDVRDYLQRIGLPTLHIEDDYTLAGIEGLRTRVQAFLEMIA